ncbi:MAG: alpha/beta hydrolase [Burkholderiales bacterium]|nr:alpha/beta hydrolase [Burkholderiales bacterium]
MNVNPSIYTFLQQVDKLKIHLQEIGFKANQSNARESLINTTRTFMTECDLSVTATDETINRDKYPIPIRIYNPSPNKILPIAVFIHGGGHMCGSVAVYDGVVRKLTKYTNHIIIAIDYRLAPEFPYPTGLDDCKHAIQNIFAVLEDRNIHYTNKDITLIGDSGGAAFCTSIVMDKQFVESYNIKKQVLIYPSVDYTLTLPSTDQYGVGYLLEKNKIAWYFDNYFQNNEDRKEKSPLYNKFYNGMPETLVIVASHDPLRSEGEEYYQKVIGAGNQAKLKIIDGVIHAYLMLENLCKEECEITYQEVARFI